MAAFTSGRRSLYFCPSVLRFGFATVWSSGPFAWSCTVTLRTFNSSRIRSANRPAARRVAASPSTTISASGCRTLILPSFRAAKPSETRPNRASMSVGKLLVDQGRVGLREIAQVDALRFAGRLEVLIHRLRQERHDRGEQFRQRHQHRVQRLIGGQFVGALFALPEAAPVAADVPVAQLVIDELLRLQAERHQVVVLERRPRRPRSAAASPTESSGRGRGVARPARPARTGRSRPEAGRSCRRRRRCSRASR